MGVKAGNTPQAMSYRREPDVGQLFRNTHLTSELSELYRDICGRLFPNSKDGGMLRLAAGFVVGFLATDCGDE